MCRPCASRVSTTKLGECNGWLIKVAPSTVRSGALFFLTVNSPYLNMKAPTSVSAGKVFFLSLDYSGSFDKMRISQDRPKMDIGQEGDTCRGDQA